MLSNAYPVNDPRSPKGPFVRISSFSPGGRFRLKGIDLMRKIADIWIQWNHYRHPQAHRFDALASVTAAKLLYPEAQPLIPGTINPNVKAFVSIHKDIFPWLEAKKPELDGVERLWWWIPGLGNVSPMPNGCAKEFCVKFWYGITIPNGHHSGHLEMPCTGGGQHHSHVTLSEERTAGHLSDSGDPDAGGFVRGYRTSDLSQHHR